jgi:hypothetical protein
MLFGACHDVGNLRNIVWPLFSGDRTEFLWLRRLNIFSEAIKDLLNPKVRNRS